MSDDNLNHQGQAPNHHDPLVDCPTCGLPAAITDRFVLHAAPSPVEHVKLVCVRGHWYTLPVDHLSGSSSPTAGQCTASPTTSVQRSPGGAYNSVADSRSFAAIQTLLKDTSRAPIRVNNPFD